MGLLCAPIGLATGLYIAITAIGNGYGGFIIAAPIAAYLSGTFSWWIVMVRPSREGLFPAAFAGGLAAVLGHYLCWYILFVGMYALAAARGQIDGSMTNPLQAFKAAFFFGSFSLILLGWATVPAGALLGVLLKVLERRRLQRTSS
jgi:hypothetical protein